MWWCRSAAALLRWLCFQIFVLPVLKKSLLKVLTKARLSPIMPLIEDRHSIGISSCHNQMFFLQVMIREGLGGAQLPLPPPEPCDRAQARGLKYKLTVMQFMNSVNLLHWHKTRRQPNTLDVSGIFLPLPLPAAILIQILGQCTRGQSECLREIYEGGGFRSRVPTQLYKGPETRADQPKIRIPCSQAPSEEMCSEARMALFALLTFGKGQTQDVHTSMLPAGNHEEM